MEKLLEQVYNIKPEYKTNPRRRRVKGSVIWDRYKITASAHCCKADANFFSERVGQQIVYYRIVKKILFLLITQQEEKGKDAVELIKAMRKTESILQAYLDTVEKVHQRICDIRFKTNQSNVLN